MTKKDPQKFNIYEYTDYRFLLKEYYTLQKKMSRAFSFRYFSAKAGVSASVLKDIMAGRRRLTMDVMQKYSQAMRLNQKETEYFGVVVEFVNSKTNDDKNAQFTKLLRMRGNFMMKFIEENKYEFFKNWYYSAIREMVTLVDFREDYDWIGKKCFPRITAAQARKAVELMLELGIMRRNEKGNLELTDAVISSEYEFESFLLKNFHTMMILLAKEALERFKPQEREISSLTLGVSHKCYSRIKERIRTFKQEIITMVVEDTSRSETVCQCNFQLFPLVKDNLEGKGNLA
jgi:uncharacterized protein (TIGR02147 family)